MLTSDGSNICVVPKSFELELELDFERILCVFFFHLWLLSIIIVFVWLRDWHVHQLYSNDN